MKVYIICNDLWQGHMENEVFESKEDAKARCWELANELKESEWRNHGYSWSNNGISKDSIKVYEDSKGVIWIALRGHFSQVFRVQELKVKGKLA